MVYESDFYTTRRPYSRPLVSSYSITDRPIALPLSTILQLRGIPHMPYVAHKRLVTVIHMPYHTVYHGGSLLPIRVHARVRPSVLAAEINRIRNLSRPWTGSYTEKYLQSKDHIYFDDEAREIRARVDSLLRRVHVFVPRAVASDFLEEIVPERMRSGDYVRRLLSGKQNAKKDPEPISWYEVPERGNFGNLACVKYVAGNPQSVRRPYFKVADLRPSDIKNDVNFLSYYKKNRQAAADASRALQPDVDETALKRAPKVEKEQEPKPEKKRESKREKPVEEPKPEPVKQPEPVEEPEPVKEPEPVPEPVKEPEPAPEPVKQPEPAKKAKSAKKPAPVKKPEPEPEPVKEPEPVPEPVKEPEPVPEPVKEPEPVPEPVKEPEPVPEPVKEPEPVPEPVKEPEPVPEPVKEPEPEPVKEEAQPEPVQEPQPEVQEVAAEPESKQEASSEPSAAEAVSEKEEEGDKKVKQDKEEAAKRIEQYLIKAAEEARTDEERKRIAEEERVMLEMEEMKAWEALKVAQERAEHIDEILEQEKAESERQAEEAKMESERLETERIQEMERQMEEAHVKALLEEQERMIVEEHLEEVRQQEEREVRLANVTFGDADEVKNLDSHDDTVGDMNDQEKEERPYELMMNDDTWVEERDPQDEQFETHEEPFVEEVEGADSQIHTGATAVEDGPKIEEVPSGGEESFEWGDQDA
ncbi:uncharacterized protein LOC143349727 isoform X2 [Colletes latitarsis]|uniref:uncharacterized protein LOC143349727 isoform X2 n=1 Tax=Colletes latitarsis TaxID=2605962 RepID=UPI0040373165